MAITNTLIPSLAAGPIFTATTGTEFAVTTMMFCNTDSVDDAYLDLWIVPFGGVAGTPSGQILKQIYIPVQETFVMDTEKLILSSQDAIWAQVNANASLKVNATVSYVQIS